MSSVISVKNLCHSYGDRPVYDGLNLSLQAGRIYALLGKNGVGKTTLIKILMGFLQPQAGECRVFGELSHDLSPQNRIRIGLLFEGHLAWDFFSVTQIERFYSAFYPDWSAEVYYHLVDRLGLSGNSQIRNLSCGERSQIVLGLLLAQQPELLILDDYSVGLDAGYRRLFLDIMREFCQEGDKTILLTSHLIQDMAGLVDEAVFLKKGGAVMVSSLVDFQQNFQCFSLASTERIVPCDKIINVEYHNDYTEIFSFSPQQELEEILGKELTPQAMTLEDAFIGYTGRY